jgi:hypothetical protein
MKLIPITLLAFAGSFAHAQDPSPSDDDYDGWGPTSYHALMMHLHQYVWDARAILSSDLKKSEESADFDDQIFAKIVLDEKKLNAAIWHLQHPEDIPGEKNPYED